MSAIPITSTFQDGNVCNEVPTLTLPNFPSLCEGDSPLTLTGASPLGGIYTGTGVVGGVFIDKREDLEKQLKIALNDPGPMLIDVRVRRNENIYPMVPPGKSNAQMVGLPKINEAFNSLRRKCSNCGTTSPNGFKHCPECGSLL